MIGVGIEAGESPPPVHFRKWRLEPAEIAHLPAEQQLDILERELGLDVESFYTQPHGQYLAERALHELRQARDLLETVDPEDAKAVRRYQMQAAVARRFLEWCLQPIVEGQKAEQRIHEADQADDIRDY